MLGDPSICWRIHLFIWAIDGLFGYIISAIGFSLNVPIEEIALFFPQNNQYNKTTRKCQKSLETMDNH
jgi:hypothetical protein